MRSGGSRTFLLVLVVLLAAAAAAYAAPAQAASALALSGAPLDPADQDSDQRWRITLTNNGPDTFSASQSTISATHNRPDWREFKDPDAFFLAYIHSPDRPCQFHYEPRPDGTIPPEMECPGPTSLAPGATDTITVSIHMDAPGDYELFGGMGFQNPSGPVTSSGFRVPTRADPATFPSAKCEVYRVSRGEKLDAPAGIGLLANDSDPKGMALAVETKQISFDQSKYTLDSSTGAFTYDATENDPTVATIRYAAKAADGRQSPPRTAYVLIDAEPPPEAAGCDERDISADLEVLESDDPQEAEAGDEIETTTTVVNHGPAPAEAARLAETVQGQGEVIGASPSKGSCSAGQTVTCSFGTLGVGETASVRVRTKAGSIAEPEGGDSDPDEVDAARVRPKPAFIGQAEVEREKRIRSQTRDRKPENNSRKGKTKVGKCAGRLGLRGGITVRAGCFLEKKKDIYTAKGRVVVNGLTVEGTAEFTLDTNKLTLSGGGQITVKASLKGRSITLYKGKRSFSLAAKRKFTLTLPKGAKLVGLPLTGSVSAEFSKGRLDFDATVGLPAAMGGLRLGTSFHVQDGVGLRVDSLRIDVAEVKVGKILTVKELKLRYEPTPNEWFTSATVLMPGPKGPRVDATLRLLGGKLKELELKASNIQRPLATGVFLQAIGAKVKTGPLFIGGTMEISAGPEVFGRTAASIAGEGSFAQDKSGGFGGTYRVGGNVKLVSEELANGFIEYQTPSTVRLGGKLDWSVWKFGIGWDTAGSIEGTRSFLLEGKGKVRIPGNEFTTTQGLVSNIGIGACAGPLGFRWKWGDTLPRPFCDLGSIRPASLRRAQDGARTFSLPAGLPHAALEVAGTGAAPALRITGPDGKATDVPVSDVDAVDDGSIYAFRRDEDATTFVLIRKPAGGQWRLELLPESAPIASVGVASGTLPPSVSGKVKRKGRSYVLTWKLRKIAGQRVSFVDQATGRVLASSTRASGSIKVKPGSGPRKRRLVAQV